MAFSGKYGLVSRTKKELLTFSDVVGINVSGNTNEDCYIFIVGTNGNGFINIHNTITVEKDSVALSDKDFRVDELGRVWIKKTAISGATQITASGSYNDVVNCATIFSWKLDIQSDLKETTTFADNGFKTYTAVAKSWSCNADGYWANADFSNLVGEEIVISLIFDKNTGEQFRGRAILKKNSVDNPGTDVIKEGLDLEGSGHLFYIDSTTTLTNNTY